MSTHAPAPRKLPNSIWAELRTAHASGLGLRELARNAGIPAGTVLARAQREGWTRQIQQARAIVTAPQDSPTVSPAHAAAVSMQERATRHVERMAGLVEKTLPHLEAMEPGAILDRVEDIDRLDKVARRSYGLDDEQQGQGGTGIAIQINIG